MIFVPTPATAGVKVPVPEFTPGPEYVPPSGIPPFNLMGFALTVVMVSKQAAKETLGASIPLRMIFGELAGFPVTQLKLEVMIHRTLSPLAGL